MPPPKDKLELRTFLGMVAYVQHFIPNCGVLNAPLSAITGAKSKFVWTPNMTSVLDISRKSSRQPPSYNTPNETESTRWKLMPQMHPLGESCHALPQRAGSLIYLSLLFLFVFKF
ncbi:hypothetical protein DSO57_1039243 [Entomophthora muscae]|uniref:Uncharacterized protein n=1 Tax=Entomophthora muscae TaxID=34485 RepID=A0ACC2SYT0_9FUNG|nr:hypothetical protein DSO57_1039243 [Entomophthora muscae]